MKVIGLTGGIGSGKSTVARAFASLGVPVYIADDESKLILNQHPAAINKIRALLGEKAYSTNAEGITVANRKFIASQVFTNNRLLQELNQILHPLVREHFKQWLIKQESTYVIYEAAILFESSGDQYCDATILVWANEWDRINRVVKRDRVSVNEVRQRLQNQWSDTQRLEKADYVIINRETHKINSYVMNFNDFMLK